MAAGEDGGPAGDLYQLLGVPREASREEITLAWRRRARDEHPDARPGDAAAAARFRAIAEAYQVLGDPGRRAAYDQNLGRGQRGAARIPVRRSPRTNGTGGMPAPGRAPEPPLVAGPVRVEGGHPERSAGGWDEQDLRLAVLAELTLRYLAAHRGRPW